MKLRSTLLIVMAGVGLPLLLLAAVLGWRRRSYSGHGERGRNGNTLACEGALCAGDLEHDGQAALRMTHSWDPDVVLLDIGLPDIDGYEVARRLGERQARPKIIALTGYGEPDDQRKSHKAGCDLHLVKPVSVDELRDAFAQLLSAVRARA
jgi:CheY-like chemotaxis protein